MEIASTPLERENAERVQAKTKRRFFSWQRVHKFNRWFKTLAGTLIIINLVSYGFTKLMLEDSNQYLKLFGIESNLGSEHLELTQSRKRLQALETDLEAQIFETRQDIINKNFYIHEDFINEIKSNQRVWLNRYGIENLQVGLLDMTESLKKYINEGHFNHSIIQKNSNNIEIKSVHFTEEKANFTIVASNFFGNIFLLSSQITDIINGLPYFYDGEILNYQRQENQDGRDSMSFSINLKLQTPDFQDPEDNNISSRQFLNWASNNPF